MGLREKAAHIKNDASGLMQEEVLPSHDFSGYDDASSAVFEELNLEEHASSAKSSGVIDELGESLSGADDAASFTFDEDLSEGNSIADDFPEPVSDFDVASEKIFDLDDISLPSEQDKIFHDADEPLASEISMPELSEMPEVSPISGVAEEPFPELLPEDSITFSDDAFSPEADSTPPKNDNSDERLLVEISKEIIRAGGMSQLSDVLLFSIMGHIPLAAASVILPDGEPNKFYLSEARGVKIKSRKITFKSGDYIFSRLADGKIVDLKMYHRIDECRDEYFKFMSIGANILVPVCDSENVKMVLSLGEKITAGNFSDDELAFIERIADIAAVAVDRCSENDALRVENSKLNEAAKKLIDIDTYENRIRRSGTDFDIESFVRAEMDVNGVESFSFFVRDENLDHFSVKFSKERDSLNLRESGFAISVDNALTAYLMNIESFDVIENPVNNEMLHRIFKEEMLTQMNTFISFPYVIRGRLLGFCFVFRTEKETDETNLVQINRLVRVVFSYLLSRKSLELYIGNFFDASEPVLKRLADEIKRADMMKIPLTFVNFSIKNYRRYTAVYGEESAAEVMSYFKNMLKQRLSETDFSIRVDRGCVISVFPGKSKKIILSLANAMRNELVSAFRGREVPLMVTFLAAEYPQDGKDVSSLLSLIE